MTRGSGGYIFNANIEPSRFSNQWLDWGVWQIWSSAICKLVNKYKSLRHILRTIFKQTNNKWF